MTNKFLRLIALLAAVIFTSSAMAQMVSRADAKRQISESLQRTGKTVNVGMQMQASQIGQYVEFYYRENDFRKVPLPKSVYASLPFDSLNLSQYAGVSAFDDSDEARRVFAALVHAGVIEGKLIEVKAGAQNAYRYSVVEMKKGILQRRDNKILVPIYEVDDVEIVEVAVAGTGLSTVKYKLKLGPMPSRQTLLDEGFRFFSTRDARDAEFRQTDRGWKLSTEVALTWQESKFASVPPSVGTWLFDEVRQCWLYRAIGNLAAQQPIRNVSWSGSCRDGLAEGKGSIEFNGMLGVIVSGEVEYVNGKLNGPAKLLSAKGDKFQGQYKDGVGHGMGTTVKSDGEVVNGEYRNGVLIRKL